MSDDDIYKECAATPTATLEEYITNPCIPKNENEWWASREIERLHSQIESAEEAYVRLDASMNRLKAAFRVNMLRAFPNMSHEEIDAEIEAAIRENE